MKKYLLSEIAEIVNGATPSSKETKYYDGDVIWLTPKDLSNQKSKYISKGERNITELGFKSCSTHMIPSHNIIMSSRAPIGLLAINEVECCTNQGFKNLVVKKDVVDVEYLFYYLKYHMSEIEALGSGTTFKEVSKESLGSFCLELPEIEEQRQIAAVLQSLDDKISLNNEINQNLEAMAKLLYKYWFVQFDFPNDDGKPYKSSGGEMIWNETIQCNIPIGWKVQTIDTLADLNKQSYGTSNLPKKIKYLDTSSLTCNTISHVQEYGTTEKIPSRARRRVQPLTILYSTVRPSQCHYGILMNPEEQIVVSTGFVTIDAKIAENAFYLYYYLTDDSRTDYVNTIATNSVSAYPSITSSDIAGLSMVMPADNTLVRKFNDYCISLHTLIENNNKEISSLLRQRDELLPLLMNGQVSVTQLNSDLSAH